MPASSASTRREATSTAASGSPALSSAPRRRRRGGTVRLKVKHIDRAQKVIRIEPSKGRKDRNVMLSDEMLGLLRQWWKARRGYDTQLLPLQEQFLFPGRKPGTPMTTRQLSRLFRETAEA